MKIIYLIIALFLMMMTSCHHPKSMSEKVDKNDSVRTFPPSYNIQRGEEADDFSFAYSFRAEAFLGLKRWNEATDDLIKAMSLSWDQEALYLIVNLQEPALSMLISKVKKQHAKYPNEEKWQKLLSDLNK